MADFEANFEFPTGEPIETNFEFPEHETFLANFVIDTTPDRTSLLINDGEDGLSPFATQQYVDERGDKTFIYEQGVAASEWNVTHNLNKFPSISVVDSANDEILCDVQYINENSCKLIFTSSFKGKAYFN